MSRFQFPYDNLPESIIDLVSLSKLTSKKTNTEMMAKAYSKCETSEMKNSCKNLKEIRVSLFAFDPPTTMNTRALISIISTL